MRLLTDVACVGTESSVLECPSAASAGANCITAGVVCQGGSVGCVHVCLHSIMCACVWCVCVHLNKVTYVNVCVCR